MFSGWGSSSGRSSAVLRELNDPQMPNTDWPALGLAMLGPLVMTLMPAKLARREKHAGDYWWLHGLALAAAALAAALAEDLLAFVLIGAYAGAAIWNLVAFSLLRAAGAINPIPGQGLAVHVAGVVGDGRRPSTMWVAAVMAIVGLALTIPLYLITPRSTFQKLEFGKPRVEIGFAADQMVDLNQTGTLRGNDRIAFEVIAEDDTGHKVELSPDQRWRGVVKGRYQSGKWPDSTDFRLPAVSPAAQPVVTVGSLPSLWPDQIVLSFAVPSGGRSRFLADPVRWEGGQPAPVFSASQSGYRTWVWGGNGSFIPDGRPRTADETVRYVQLWTTTADDDLSTPFLLIDHNTPSVLRPLRQNPVPKVKEYADRLVERMVSEKRLPVDHHDRVSMLPRREFHDAIARAFSTHLATTPNLSYTTNLRRDRKDLDPIEDFLFHTRAGHCERFATALVLMLRSQGIPAVLVLGFKGCEPTDEPGRYVVRQAHAHAWVEALIEDFQPRPWWGVASPSRWRSLDPTPAAGPRRRDRGWLDATAPHRGVRRLYNAYVVDYTPSSEWGRSPVYFGAVARWQVLAGILALLAAAFFARKLIALAAKRGAGQQTETPLVRPSPCRPLRPRLRFQPGETAREFATRHCRPLAPGSRDGGHGRGSARLGRGVL